MEGDSKLRFKRRKKMKNKKMAIIMLGYHLQRRLSKRCPNLRLYFAIRKVWTIFYRFFFFPLENSFVICERQMGKCWPFPQLKWIRIHLHRASEANIEGLMSLLSQSLVEKVMTEGCKDGWNFPSADSLLLWSVTEKCTSGYHEMQSPACCQQENHILAFQTRDIEMQSCCS